MARIIVRPSVDGWLYKIIGTGGVLLAQGWIKGTMREAQAHAEEHAREKGLTIDG